MEEQLKSLSTEIKETMRMLDSKMNGKISQEGASFIELLNSRESRLADKLHAIRELLKSEFGIV
jgi:hypothetical protein